MKQNKLLFRTVHGSRLYHLENPNSDYDYWEVYANEVPSPAKWIKQKIAGENDTVKMNLSTFMLYATRSSHQVLDCMFSQSPEVDLIKDLRANYWVNTGTFVPLYQRTIKAFGMAEDLKSKRHAVRMCFQLQDGLEYGRFNPRVTEKRRQFLLDQDVHVLHETWQQMLGQT